jgi:hypothetical protein
LHDQSLDRGSQAVLAKFLQFKVNFPVVFGGAFLIILLIKLTPYLLPAKYYFNFSTLMGNDSTALIVDPPTITGAKLCEVMDHYNIPSDAFSHYISCGQNYEDKLSPDQVDKIYSIALQSDQAVRDAFANVLAQMPITPLTDAEVRTTVAEARTVDKAFSLLVDKYTQQITDVAGHGPAKAIEDLYSEIVVNNQDTGGQDDTTARGPGLSSDLTQRIVQANQSITPALASATLARQIPPIKKSSIDGIVQHIQNFPGTVEENVTNYYTNSLVTAVSGDVSRAFAKAGLALGRNDVDRKIVFNEINKLTLQNYIIAILLRLAPVLLFGLVAGALIGRTELFSIALAAGLAAFLLCWPLILMWDRLVQTGWTDKRPMFLALYAIYMISFFITARSAALLGAWLQERQLVGLTARSMQNAGLGFSVTWREVTINVVGAMVLNSLVYAWNLFLPLSAGGGSQ